MQARIETAQKALEGFELSFKDETLRQEIFYLDEMLRWNAHINLTSIVDPLEMLEKHLVDSLILLKWCQPGVLLDVGSGAGLPGVALAIATNQIYVTSVEAVGKKCAFQKHIKRRLGLKNLHLVNQRIETYQAEDKCLQIVARAFAGVEKTVNYTRHLLSFGGRLYLMLGAAELEENAFDRLILRENLRLVARHKYNLPFSGASRQVIVLEKSTAVA